MIKSKYGNDFFNVFKTIVFLEKAIKRQLENKNHDVNKLISDKKLLKHFTSISLKRMQ